MNVDEFSKTRLRRKADSWMKLQQFKYEQQKLEQTTVDNPIYK